MEFFKQPSQLLGLVAAQKRLTLELFQHGLVTGTDGVATVVADTITYTGTSAVTIVLAATIDTVTPMDMANAATVPTDIDPFIVKLEKNPRIKPVIVSQVEYKVLAYKDDIAIVTTDPSVVLPEIEAQAKQFRAFQGEDQAWRDKLMPLDGVMTIMAELRDGFTSLGARFNALNSRMDQLCEQLNQQTFRLDGVDRRILEIEDDNTNIEMHLQKVERLLKLTVSKNEELEERS
ncbi:hypothetical protein NDU88_004347 [Pleurodeles waltl]|uniref:Uncharacterized protein n=1 Tax=Pleurodeles waltl TaxID=8319 RepID=A0AAV7MUW1_PLEWA|nr:hypothetical protein NDU88_004347 [Pleurodeles waltl]